MVGCGRREVSVLRAIGTACVGLFVVATMGCAPVYRPGPVGPIASPTIGPWHPDRARFQLPTPPAFMQRLHAQHITLKLVDGRAVARSDAEGAPVLGQRTGEERLQVSLHRAFAPRAQARLDALVDGDPSAPSLTMLVKVNELLAWYGGDETREISVALEMILTTADGHEVMQGPVKAWRELRGAPYDRRELDELHLGVCLAAFDSAFSEHNLSESNKTLQQLQQAAPSPVPSTSTPL